jgi:parvulin-like peptidyl-prolyl isomerase
MKTGTRTSQLLHLALAGFFLALLLFFFLGPPTSEEMAKRIVITDGDLEQLRIAWFRRWQRNPTQQEMQAQIQQYVREEVLYREALARGYDKDDPLVRRAMQQKMEFLGQSQAQTDTISDEQIEAYFAFRREQYRVPAVVSFHHIFFNLDQRGQAAETDAQATLGTLQDVAPEDPRVLQYGDRFLLQHEYSQATERDVRSDFGEEFAASVVRLEPKKWQGPVRSGYGLHLVYVTERTDSYVPDWQTLKSRILDDMDLEARNAARELFYTEILRTYEIVYRGEALDLVEGGTEE